MLQKLLRNVSNCKNVLPYVSWVGDILVNYDRIATRIMLTDLFKYSQYLTLQWRVTPLNYFVAGEP